MCQAVGVKCYGGQGSAEYRCKGQMSISSFQDNAMNHLRKTASTLCILLPTFHIGFAQYFGEQVMEKSFEQTDFFFTPYRLVPFGIGTFKNSVAGVLDDPLLNLHVNPAYLPRDSMHASYGYVDFRSAKEIRDESNIYHPYPVFAVRTIEAASFIPYPRFYINTRRELEPVISAAYLFHPTEGALKNLSLVLSDSTGHIQVGSRGGLSRRSVGCR